MTVKNTQRQIYVTAYDLQRLNDRLAELDTRQQKAFAGLIRELDRAKVVAPAQVPADVVTMNSRLRYRDLEDDSVAEVTLVFPEQADVDAGRMSVFSPMGTALLGYAAGDEIAWEVPAGVRRIRIESLEYQPEAAGDTHL